MEDIMEDNFEKLNLLLEQEQCEFVDIPDGFTGQTESGELRLIYLMNDAVESFLILKNARMTGNYVRDYEGEFEGSIEKADRDLCEAEYILVIHQASPATILPPLMAAMASSSQSKTLAGPSCTIISSHTALFFTNPPSGARFPVSTASPPVCV